MLLKCLGWKKKDIKAWPRGAVFLRWKSYLGEDALVASLKEPSEVFQDNIPHLTDLICGSARHPCHYLPSSNSSFSPAPLFWQSQCASSLSEILTWSEDLQTNLDCISSWQDFWFLAAQNCISGNRANLFLKLMLYFLKTRFPFLAERVIKSGSFKVSVVSNLFFYLFSLYDKLLIWGLSPIWTHCNESSRTLAVCKNFGAFYGRYDIFQFTILRYLQNAKTITTSSSPSRNMWNGLQLCSGRKLLY